jgi:hypothetical protein
MTATDDYMMTLRTLRTVAIRQVLNSKKGLENAQQAVFVYKWAPRIIVSIAAIPIAGWLMGVFASGFLLLVPFDLALAYAMLKGRKQWDEATIFWLEAITNWDNKLASVEKEILGLMTWDT